MKEFGKFTDDLIPGISREMHTEYFNDWRQVGSSVTCNPIPQGADEDYLVDVYNLEAVQIALELEGFERDGMEQYEGTSLFISMRKGAVNLIITEDTPFYERFLVATYAAWRLNLLSKEDRIMLFQAVLYGKKYEPKIEGFMI